MVATALPLAPTSASRPGSAVSPLALRAANDGALSVPSLMVRSAPAVDDAVLKATRALSEPLVLPEGVSLAVEAPVAVEAPAEPRRFRWARNVLLGAGVSFMDSGISTLKPLRFVWDNLPVVAQAIIYMALPLIPSFMLLSYVPNLATTFSLHTPIGALYLLGLYVSSAFFLMLASFSAGFCWRGGLKLMDHFAQAGEEAFPAENKDQQL